MGNVTVAEFATQSRAVLWHTGNSAYLQFGAAMPTTTFEKYRAARFSPDGRWLAIVNARGELLIDRAVPPPPR